MVRIIGGGLAGSEAAWQVASRGVPVTLYEMRPVRATAVHKTDQLAELVCSNSFRGDKLDNAVGLLKERCGGSDRLSCERRTRPASRLARRWRSIASNSHAMSPTQSERIRESLSSARRFRVCPQR